MILIDHEKCVGCGLCAADCVGYNLEIREKKAYVKHDCIQCGHCVAVCPAGAVSIPEYDMAEVEPYDKARFTLDPETLLRSIKFRRSIRQYKNEKLSEQEIHMLLQAGRYTPTAKNVQDCCFVLVQNDLDGLKEQVWNQIEEIEAVSGMDAEEMKPYYAFNRRRKKNPDNDFLFRNAPAVLFITSDWPLNAGLAAQNIETMAAAMGLGMLYNGYLCRLAESSEGVKRWLGVEGKIIRACLLVGHPDCRYVRTAPRAAANVILK